MPPRNAGPRRRIATNVYADALGVAAVARVGRRTTEKRFSRGTTLKTIQAWLDAERACMRRQSATIRRFRGTLAGDVAERLTHLPAGHAKDNAGWDLAAWVTALGTDRRRPSITVADLRRVVNDWIEAGVPASTINHRRRALAQLYEALDGPEAANPVRQIKRAKEVLPDPTAYPMDALTAIIDAMDPSRGQYRKGQSSFRRTNKSRARLRLLLWCGLPPASVRRLLPRRVASDAERGELWYPPRGKGAGAHAVLLPLFPEGAQSVTCWLQASAWGTFSAASLRHALQRAAASYATRETEAGRSSPVPATITVYHLRHSFLTWLYETTGDPYLVQLYGQHADLETTRRYTRSGVPGRAREAVARVQASHDGEPRKVG